jgi:hypothetical protein
VVAHSRAFGVTANQPIPIRQKRLVGSITGSTVTIRTVSIFCFMVAEVEAEVRL